VQRAALRCSDFPTQRRGALLIRDRRKLGVWHGPGSAAQREERCAAPGTQLVSRAGAL